MICPICHEEYDSVDYASCPNCTHTVVEAWGTSMDNYSEPKLLEVIVGALEVFDKMPKDIIWIGSEDGIFSCDWEKFSEIAKNTSLWVSMPGIRLVVVGNDWWLREVTEYEYEFGKETMISRTFEFLTLPQVRDNSVCLSETGMF